MRAELRELKQGVLMQNVMMESFEMAFSCNRIIQSTAVSHPTSASNNAAATVRTCYLCSDFLFCRAVGTHASLAAWHSHNSQRSLSISFFSNRTNSQLNTTAQNQSKWALILTAIMFETGTAVCDTPSSRRNIALAICCPLDAT